MIHFLRRYTESLFALATFSTLSELYAGRHVHSAGWLMVACLTRSNGVVLLMFFGVFALDSFSRVLMESRTLANVMVLLFLYVLMN